MKHFFFLLLLTFILTSPFKNYAQTEMPPVYSPDGQVTSILSKGDTLLVGGYFNHVGKYTGGGALFTPASDQPNLSFPKIVGSILSSTPDGNGGLYIYGKYKRENETGAPGLRIEHVMADNTFEPDFSLTVNALFAAGKILYSNGLLYFGGEYVSQIANQASGNLAAIDVATKQLQPWIPAITGTSVTGLYTNDNKLYFIGRFDSVAHVRRNSVAAIEIGTGALTQWYPAPNWESQPGGFSSGSFSDIVFYNDKIIISGGMHDATFFQHGCAVVDNVTGQTFKYIFQSGGLFGNGVSFLYWGAGVNALAIKGDILYAYSSGTFDTRVTAVNLADSNRTVWAKYFNPGAHVEAMAVAGNSLFIAGSYFESAYITDSTNSTSAIEARVTNAVKIDLVTRTVSNWNPAPVNYLRNDVLCLSVTGPNIFIGGNFSHVNGLERKGVYMYNAALETVLPFNINTGYFTTSVNALKLLNDTLYIGGSLQYSNGFASAAAFNISTGEKLTWSPPDLGKVYAIEANSNYVVLGGELAEPAGGIGRINLVALDKNAGSLLNWTPNPNSGIFSLHLFKDNLFVGGNYNFNSIAGQSRNQAASFDVNTSLLTNWNPGANNTVNAIHARDNTIWLGGSFSRLADSSRNMLAGVNPFSGTARSSPLLDSFTRGTIFSIQSKGLYLLLGGYFKQNSSTAWNNLMLYNLFDKNIVPAGILFKDINEFDAKVYSMAVTKSDVFYGGDFIKSNNRVNAPFIGRIKYPGNFFDAGGDYISVQNGNWNDAATWEKNEVPPATARVIVRHNVIVTQDAACYSLHVEKTTGNLNVNAGIELKILSEY